MLHYKIYKGLTRYSKIAKLKTHSEKRGAAPGSLEDASAPASSLALLSCIIYAAAAGKS